MTSNDPDVGYRYVVDEDESEYRVYKVPSPLGARPRKDRYSMDDNPRLVLKGEHWNHTIDYVPNLWNQAATEHPRALKSIKDVAYQQELDKEIVRAQKGFVDITMKKSKEKKLLPNYLAKKRPDVEKRTKINNSQKYPENLLRLTCSPN